MNVVDAGLCLACAGTFLVTRLDPEAGVDNRNAVAIISFSLLLGISARSLRNADLVDTLAIYHLNPVIDMTIGAWAWRLHILQPREWTRLLALTSFAALAASAAYGLVTLAPGARYIYALTLNALLLTALGGIGWGGIRHGLFVLGRSSLRRRFVLRRL